MMCQNCGKNEVTFRYTQVINGVKKEMNLCDKCARELGLKDMNFSMPINFSSFLSDFFNDYSDSLLPSFTGTQTLQCKRCGTTFDDFVNSGEFGCSDCYDLFEDRITTILKNLQGATRHIGRGYREITVNDDEEINTNKTRRKVEKKENKEDNELDKLQKDLQKAIKDERYEDAAKIRDEIKDIENKEKNKIEKKEENKEPKTKKNTKKEDKKNEEE